MTDRETPYLTTRESAEILDVSPMTVTRMALDGRLTPVRKGAAALLFRRRHVENLAAERNA